MKRRLYMIAIFNLLIASCLSDTTYAYQVRDDRIRDSEREPIRETTVHISSYSPKSRPPAFSFGPISGSKPKASDQALQYEIKAGDTLYRISKHFGVSIDVLALENRLDDPNLLQIGQKLRIPSAGSQVAGLLNEKEREAKKVITATLTAYTAGVESTGKSPSHPEYGITASGTKVKEGRTIAVDPTIIPYGSTVYIEGIGIRTAEDTGSAIKGSRIDIFMNDVKSALKFGVKKNVKVYVLSNPKERT